MSSSFRSLLFCAAAVALTAQPPPDLREAARLDAAGKCAESAPIYERALAKGMPTTALLNNAGNHYLACGAPARAGELFQKLVQRVPSHANANLQLARLGGDKREAVLPYLHMLTVQSDPALLAEAGVLYARLGEYNLAQQALQRAVAAKPGNFQLLWNLGRAAARAGDVARAIETLAAAQRLRPEDAGVLFELGAAHASAGEFPRAVFLLAQAQQKAPERPEIALALARAADDAGYSGDAAIAYERYVALRPEDSKAWRDLASVVARIPGREGEGLKKLEEYMAGHPQDPLAHLQWAQLCWSADAEKSLAHLAEAVRLDPQLADAHMARAWLLHRHGRDDEALNHLERALALRPGEARVLDLYGLVLIALERTGEAEKAFRKAAGLAPKSWEVRLHLGRVLMEQGREQEAREWLDQYQKLRPPRQRDPRQEAGMIELATMSPAARREREIARFNAMVRARPDDALLRLHLGTLLLADGREEAAEKEFSLLSALNADPETLTQAGRMLINERRYRWAIPLLERAGATMERAIAVFNLDGGAEALAVLEGVPVEQRSGGFRLLQAQILDSLGRKEESRRLLTDTEIWKNASPEIAEPAAVLLANQGRFRDAARLLAEAVKITPGNRSLLLAEAVAVALEGRTVESEQRLQRIEERWPEWAAPYLAHALLLDETKRNREAERKRRTAAALGHGSAKAACASLLDWLSAACRGSDR